MRLYAEDAKKLNAVREYLDRNLRYHYTIRQLAEKFELNRNKLSAGFKRQYNTGVYAYLKKQRMEKAKDLLQLGIREKQIALQIGYKYITNFSTAFKKYWGNAPSHYRTR